MNLLLLVVILIVLFGFGGGYYGYRSRCVWIRRLRRNRACAADHRAAAAVRWRPVLVIRLLAGLSDVLATLPADSVQCVVTSPAVLRPARLRHGAVGWRGCGVQPCAIRH